MVHSTQHIIFFLCVNVIAGLAYFLQGYGQSSLQCIFIFAFGLRCENLTEISL